MTEKNITLLIIASSLIITMWSTVGVFLIVENYYKKLFKIYIKKKI